jgi:hypothetical protein
MATEEEHWEQVAARKPEGVARSKASIAGSPLRLQLLIEAVAAVPLLYRLLRVALKVPLAPSLIWHLAPRRGELEHDAHPLWGLGQRGVDC